MRARSGNCFAYFFRMAIESGDELRRRKELRETVAAMFAPVAVLPSCDAIVRAAELYGCAYGNETDNGTDDSGDGGAKVRRRLDKLGYVTSLGELCRQASALRLRMGRPCASGSIVESWIFRL